MEDESVTRTQRRLYDVDRIIDKIRSLGDDGTFVSFEFFPPKTNEGKANLLARIQRMSIDLVGLSASGRRDLGAHKVHTVLRRDRRHDARSVQILRVWPLKTSRRSFFRGIHMAIERHSLLDGIAKEGEMASHTMILSNSFMKRTVPKRSLLSQDFRRAIRTAKIQTST